MLRARLDHFMTDVAAEATKSLSIHIPQVFRPGKLEEDLLFDSLDRGHFTELLCLSVL